MPPSDDNPPPVSGVPPRAGRKDDGRPRPILRKFLEDFRDRPLELAGVMLTLGSFVALLLLITVSFVPDAPEFALIKGFQSLLTMASIGIIAVIASRQTEQLITALAIVIIAVVFVSIDDLVRLYVTVSGSDRDVTTVLSSRTTNSAEFGGGKRDFEETARRIREHVEESVGPNELSDVSLGILQEDIRRIIVEAEYVTILQRITDKGADELLSEIYDGEFVVSFLKYESLPEFQSDLQLLRFEGLIDDRYGDLPETVEVTELGCLILMRRRNQDLNCRTPEIPEIIQDSVSPIDTIDPGEQRLVGVRDGPAVLSLVLRSERRLRIEAVPAAGSDLDPLLEVYEDQPDGARVFIVADDDSAGGLNARVDRTFPAGTYLINTKDFYGRPGEIRVVVNAMQERSERPVVQLDPSAPPTRQDLLVGGDNDSAELALEIVGDSRIIRIEGRSEWLDTVVNVFRIDNQNAPVREWELVSSNDDRAPGILDACVEVELEAGWYAVLVSDFNGLTGEATAIIGNEMEPSDEPCVRDRPDTSAQAR